jgi:hypothetical protein
MTHEDEHLADVKRDAIALWRAVLGGDHEGAGVIASNTRCGGCLAIQAVGLGIVLTADEPFIDDTGHVAVSDAEREAIDDFLATFQAERDLS